MILATIAFVALAQADIPHTPGEAMQQVDRNAKEMQETERYWIDKHQKDDEIKALHDIEDAIIFDSLEEGDD